MLPLNYIGLLSALTSISVHAIALDRRAISDPDLLIRYPWPVNWNQTHPNPDPNRVLLHRSPLINAFKPRNTTNLNHKRTPTPSSDPSNIAPTPAPTAPGSDLTTVHITSQSDFALLLPKTSGEKISDAEADGVAYCSGSGCANTFPEGFITGSAVKSADDGSWIQITGCLNPSLFPFAKGDDGGQFDVRFPNGAQCTFGGYGASFIELIEPSASRFCLRCCKSANDQANCNSHRDGEGCLGMGGGGEGVYAFSDKGVDCSG